MSCNAGFLTLHELLSLQNPRNHSFCHHIYAPSRDTPTLRSIEELPRDLQSAVSASYAPAGASHSWLERPQDPWLSPSLCAAARRQVNCVRIEQLMMEYRCRMALQCAIRPGPNWTSLPARLRHISRTTLRA